MKVQGIVTIGLQAEKVKRFGVNLKDFHQDHIMTREQSKKLSPLIWKVVELYRAFRCPQQASVGGSATDASSSGGRRVGKREMIPKFKVTIYPGPGGSFQGVHPIPEHMRTASIMSTFIVEFSQETTGAKFIHVTTQTQFNLGRNRNSQN
jgi:hypothetical protein